MVEVISGHTTGRFLANDAYGMETPQWTGYRLGWNQPNNVNDPTGNLEASDGYGGVSVSGLVEFSGSVRTKPLNEYVRYKNEDGEWVTRKVSNEGGDDVDIIHTVDGKIPQKDASITTIYIINFEGGYRLLPGVFQTEVHYFANAHPSTRRYQLRQDFGDQRKL